MLGHSFPIYFYNKDNVNNLINHISSLICELDNIQIDGFMVMYSLNTHYFFCLPSCRSVAYDRRLPGPDTHPLHLPMFQHGFLLLQRARLNIYAQNDELANEKKACTEKEK